LITILKEDKHHTEIKTVLRCKGEKIDKADKYEDYNTDNTTRSDWKIKKYKGWWAQ